MHNNGGACTDGPSHADGVQLKGNPHVQKHAPISRQIHTHSLVPSLEQGALLGELVQLSEFMRVEAENVTLHINPHP